MMTKFQKAVALSLVLALVVFAAAACGVPDEDEFEELEEQDDLGYQLEIEGSFAELDFEAETASSVNVTL